MNGLPKAWRVPALMWFLLAALVLWAQWEPAQGMAMLWWRSGTFAHGMLVPPIVAWLVWRKRQELATLVPEPNWLALALVAVAVAFGSAGWLTEVNVLQHFGVVLTLQAMTLALLGWRVVRVLTFPILFLLFAPPFGEFLMSPMMLWTADFIVVALRLSGIPVFREGLHFVIPSGNWSVVEACSGLRYLVASFMVGTLFAYLNFNRWPKRLAFMLVSLLVPIVANWLRGYMIVMIGHLSSNQLATGVDHLVYGWVFFGIIMMVMFQMGARWADAAEPLAPVEPAIEFAPSKLGVHAVLAALCAALLVLPAVLLEPLRVPLSQLAQPRSDALQGLAPAGSQFTPGERMAEWAPVFLEPTVSLQSAWRQQAGEAVEVDVAFYKAQRGDSKAVNSMNQTVKAGNGDWSGAGQPSLDTPLGSSSHERWMKRKGSTGDANSYLSRRVYWVDGRFTASAREAKWLGLLQLLGGRGDAAAVLVLMTREDEAAGARLDATFSALAPPLNERLGQLAKEVRGHNPRP
jgi:exosortase A